MSEYFDLKSYVISFLQTRGCLLEEQGGRVVAALDADTAREIGVAEYARFQFAASDEVDGSDGLFRVQYGSAILERINASVQKRGSVLFVAPDDLYLKQEKLAEEVARQFQFVKIKPVWEGSRREMHEYLLAYFRYRAVSDDTREGLVSAVVSCYSLASPTGMKEIAERLMLMYGSDDDLSKRDKPQVSASSPHPIKPVLCKVAKVCETRVRGELSEFSSSMGRRRERDRKRVLDYYGSMKSEIESFIKRRKCSGEEARKQQDKIAAVERELAAKIADLEEKYVIKVTLKTVSVTAFSLPVLVNRVKLLKGNLESSVDLAWNPVTKAFDPVVCRHCRADMMTIASCEVWHLVCSKCLSPCERCGKSYCRECSVSCPKCKTATAFG